MSVTVNYPPATWKVVETNDGFPLTFIASMVTVVDDKTDIDPDTNMPFSKSYGGTITLQNMTGTQVSRLVVHHDDDRVGAQFCLPTDTRFSVTHRKLRGKTTSRALEVTIDVGPRFFEGYEQLVLTLPYDGDNNGPAFLMLRALEHARDIVSAAIDFAKRKAIEKAARKKKEQDRRRESYMSLDTP